MSCQTVFVEQDMTWLVLYGFMVRFRLSWLDCIFFHDNSVIGKAYIQT